jgi:F420-dependent oxidoreductase-like protein
MLLSTQLAYAGDPRSVVDHAVALEKAGVELAWVAEAYGFDAATLLGYLAARTETMQVGAGIFPVYTRTPALIAQTAAGLDAVSGGRAVLGLGASGPQVIEGWHGVVYDKPIGRTREVVEICRKVWRREPLTNEGLYPLPLPPGQGTGLGKPLKLMVRPVRDSIPIFLASLGDKNVELTAEIADGWLPIFFIPEKAQQVWGSALAAGTAKRDPSLGPLQISAGGMLAIGEDVTGLRQAGRGMAALYIGGMGARGRNFYNDLARRYGYEQEAAAIQDLYLSGNKRDAEAQVPAELLELTNLIGPEGYVRERVEAFREAGVTQLNVLPIGPNGLKDVETVRGWLG